jgi:hypothetical protein
MGKGAQEQVARLRQAVVAVIEQNRSIGYTPTRFIQATENGRVMNIVEVCEALITNPATLEWLEPALRRFPGMRTLEDEVTESPDGLGLSPEVVQNAKARAEFFRGIRHARGGRREAAEGGRARQAQEAEAEG